MDAVASSLPISLVPTKQGSPTFQFYNNPMDLQISHLIIPKINTSQLICSTSIFVLCCVALYWCILHTAAIQSEKCFGEVQCLYLCCCISFDTKSNPCLSL
jgi:hypothetical protein